MSKIRKEGYLLKAHPREGLFSLTVWQKRYFVLWDSGTLEYYTSYQKQPEEYCSTLNMKVCLDIVAPISVGKKHNVIKLSVRKGDRIKDYWLDCDCPSVLEEWIVLLVDVAGLTPEDSEDTEAFFNDVNGGESFRENEPWHNDRTPKQKQNRRLPSLPMIMDLEYEVPKSMENRSSKSDEYYEEIEHLSRSSRSSSTEEGSSSLPRKYTRLKDCGENVNRVTTAVSSPTDKQASDSSLPPVNPLLNDQRFQKQISKQRQDMYNVNEQDNDSDSEGERHMDEAYEEVQFHTQVTVGEPQSRTKGRSSFVAKNSSSNISPPPLPTSSTSLSPKPGAVPVIPLLTDHQLVKTRPPLPPPPQDPPTTTFSSTSSNDPDAPPPPPRSHSNRDQPSNSPPSIINVNTIESPLLPPIPERNASNKSPGGATPQPATTKPKVIKSYYTTEILTPASPEPGSGYSSESSEQSSSGDTTVVRTSSPANCLKGNSEQQPQALLANIVRGGVNKPPLSSGKLNNSKSVPSVKPKPNRPPNKGGSSANIAPPVAKKPASKPADVITCAPGSGDSLVQRSPVKLPKPAKPTPLPKTADKPPPPVRKSSLSKMPTDPTPTYRGQSNGMQPPELPPKTVGTPWQPNRPNLPPKSASSSELPPKPHNKPTLPPKSVQSSELPPKPSHHRPDLPPKSVQSSELPPKPSYHRPDLPPKAMPPSELPPKPSNHLLNLPPKPRALTNPDIPQKPQVASKLPPKPGASKQQSRLSSIESKSVERREIRRPPMPLPKYTSEN